MARRKKAPIEPKTNEYEQFLKTIELISLSLIRSSSFLKRDVFEQATSKKGHRLSYAIASKYKLETCEKDFFDASATFKVSIEDEKNRVKLVVIECTFEGHFHGGTGLMRDYAKRFTESEFRVIVWPYMREFVQGITGRMSIRPLVVPLSIRDEPH